MWCVPDSLNTLPTPPRRRQVTFATPLESFQDAEPSQPGQCKLAPLSLLFIWSKQIVPSCAGSTGRQQEVSTLDQSLLTKETDVLRKVT